MICNLFVFKPGESTMSVQQEDQLLDVANNGSFKTTFETTNLPIFWMKIKPEYPSLAITPLKTLIPFPIPYLCEADFSVVTATETKPRSTLHVRDTLRCH